MQKLLIGVIALLASACASQAERGDGVFPVVSENPERPRLRFQDGQVSKNTSCMIRLGNKLNPGVPPLFVNGAPLGFC